MHLGEHLDFVCKHNLIRKNPDGTSGMNMRYHHCFTDEDAMRWTKLLARKVNPGTFEAAMMKKSISRLKALKHHRKLVFAKRTAARRARVDAG